MLNLQGSQGLEDTVGIVDDVTLDEVKHGGEFGRIEQAHASATVLDDSHEGVEVSSHVLTKID